MRQEQWRRRAFTVAITCLSRFLILTNRIQYDAFDPFPSAPHREIPPPSVSRHAIPSAASLLDAVFVAPSPAPVRAALLICHGIGETVAHWLSAQRLLAAHQVASLVFDYSGYGKSTGYADWSQFELDAISAFLYLQRLAPAAPISVLGFSLGSGVAAATINRVSAERLILCAAFTSFQSALCAIGLPPRLASLAPPIWSAEESLRGCTLPVLIVHGGKDRLFPVNMASELASCCGAKAELIVAPDTRHNEPYRKPRLSFWGPILSCLAPPSL